MVMKETIKDLFGKVLSFGTPPEKKVLYKEVIKQKVPNESAENLLINGIKTSFNKVFTPKEKESTTSENIKKTPKKAVAKKKAPAKKASTKKTTTTKKPTTTKKKTNTTKTKADASSTSKKSPAKKATTKTTDKKAATKKPLTKKAPSKKATESKVKTTVTKKKTSTSTKINLKKTDDTPKKKAIAKKKVVTKTTSSKKPTTPAKGSKRDEKIALYIKDIKKHYGEVDEAFVAIIVKNLGPSIYRRDAELVSCSDPKELDTVRRNFLIKKLGIDASNGVLDAAIQDVCTELKGVRTKYRATFYYSLAKKFKKESVLN